MNALLPRRCANSTKEHKCQRPPMQTHIFCTVCYLQYGGYSRYSCVATPGKPAAQIHNP